MTTPHATFDPVRSDICKRVDELSRDYQRLSVSEIVRRADMLRQLGWQHGLEAVRRLAGGLTDAVSRDGRAAIIPTYLQSLRDAALCDSRDARTSELLMAAVSVRLAE